VLELIRADQITIAQAQLLLESSYAGKGKGTDELEGSRNMLNDIANWLRHEYMEAERHLEEIAAENALKSPSKPSRYNGPTTSKDPIAPTESPTSRTTRSR
jgi:hypothetical protein